MADELPIDDKDRVPKVGEIEIYTDAEEGTLPLELLPFHLLLLSDLDPQAEESPDWEGPSRIHSVDKYSFADLMREMAPRLVVEVPDFIGDRRPELRVDLCFAELAAFHPEQLAAQVPAVVGLVEVRTLVQQLQDGDLAADEFKSRLDAAGVEGDWAKRLSQSLMLDTDPPPGAAEPASQDRIESLLDMVDLGDGKEAAETELTTSSQNGSHLVDMLLEVVRGEESRNGPPLPRDLTQQVVAELDRLLSRQLSALLHHPEVQRLEATWRGLKLLVDRLDFRQNIRLSVLPVAKDQLGPALYDQVLMATFSGTVQELLEAPYSVAVADFNFANTPADIEQLRDLGETMASLQVLLVAGAGAEFFGLEQAAELAKLPLLNQHMKDDRYIAWNGLRGNPQANFLALVMPRFLLRFAYGADNQVQRFGFVEVANDQPAETQAEGLLWGNGALAVGINMAHSFVETGWATRLTGVGGSGRVKDLPLWRCRGVGGEVRVPLEVVLPQSKQGELYEAGFAVLGCRPNEDVAHLAFVPTVYHPTIYDDEETTAAVRLQATIPCQVFSTHIAHYLLRFQRELGSGLDADRVREELGARLQAVLAIGNEEHRAGVVEIEVAIDQERPSFYRLEVHLTLPASILGQEFGMGM